MSCPNCSGVYLSPPNPAFISDKPVNPTTRPHSCPEHNVHCSNCIHGVRAKKLPAYYHPSQKSWLFSPFVTAKDVYAKENLQTAQDDVPEASAEQHKPKEA